MSIDKLKTKFITGAFINDVKHYFSKINEIIDWINTYGNPPYKVYRALLNQSGTNAPTAIILENTLGFTPAYEYLFGGVYKVTGTFPTTKTHMVASVRTNNNVFIYVNHSIDTYFTIATVLANGTPSDDKLSESGYFSIEIKIYN